MSTAPYKNRAKLITIYPDCFDRWTDCFLTDSSLTPLHTDYGLRYSFAREDLYPVVIHGSPTVKSRHILTTDLNQTFVIYPLELAFH